jgi:hypothetical protein
MSKDPKFETNSNDKNCNVSNNLDPDFRFGF